MVKQTSSATVRTSYWYNFTLVTLLNTDAIHYGAHFTPSHFVILDLYLTQSLQTCCKRLRPFHVLRLAQTWNKVRASLWYHCGHKTRINTDAINYGAPCNTRKRELIRANCASNISCSLQNSIRSHYSLSDVCNLMVVLVPQTKLCSVTTNAQCILAMLMYLQTGKMWR